MASFDAVLAIFVQFAPPAQRQAIFRRMRVALIPGGTLLHGYRVEQLEYGTGGPTAVVHLYTEDQLRSKLDGLDIQVLVSYDAVVGEGTGQVGMSALVDVVATGAADADVRTECQAAVLDGPG